MKTFTFSSRHKVSNGYGSVDIRAIPSPLLISEPAVHPGLAIGVFLTRALTNPYY